MQCVFLFRDAEGRLPTAEDLRRCGFRVSAAAQDDCQGETAVALPASLLLAAEAAAPYPAPSPGAPERDAASAGMPGPGG
ncbi:MAG: hypothetical protein HY916_08715 [Desulfovibrio sp.]|jgi:hypothetical protein|nr:hypothetical protein [Desulfovibrio sp.]